MKPDLHGSAAGVQPPRELFTGRNVAHAHRTAAQRALLAADLFDGKAGIIKPTQRQVAAVAGVSVPSVQKARRVNGNGLARERIRLGASLNEVVPAGNGNGLAKAWRKASSAERAALGRIVGIDAIWDRAIAPNIV